MNNNLDRSITILTTLKPLNGLASLHQSNAIKSWQILKTNPEILVMGKTAGAEKFCEDLNIKYIPEVEISKEGLPLISSIIQRGQDLATSNNIWYVNADIILFEDSYESYINTLKQFDKFLIVCRRREVKISSPLDITPNSMRSLRQKVINATKLETATAIDWFGFTKNIFENMPPFPVARTAFDNWMIWNISDKGLPVVDASQYVCLIHQSHNYETSSGGVSELYKSEEVMKSRQLVGHWSKFYTTYHSKYVINSQGNLMPATGLSYRIARPKRAIGHFLRFLHPYRIKFQDRRKRQHLVDI
jgi:hypothetical protein